MLCAEAAANGIEKANRLADFSRYLIWTPRIGLTTLRSVPKRRATEAYLLNDVLTSITSAYPKRHKAALTPNNLPPRIARRDAAPILYAVLGFPVSPRTLESWPVPTRLVNGKATFDTGELLAFARAKMEAAPNLRGGRKHT